MYLGFNAILEARGLSPGDVTLVFHTTNTPRLKARLAWMAAERHDLFEAYQSVHSVTAERTIRNRPLVVSFVPCGNDDMALVGLYRVVRVENRPTIEIYADPRFHELEKDFFATDTSPQANIARAPMQLHFRLQREETLEDLAGRVVVGRPKGRAYARVAKNCDPVIKCIRESSALVAAAPNWAELVLTAQEIRTLPSSWSARLREWRGVYLIVDERDGARYVGSAYGNDNFLGRWRAHVSGERGVTKELSHRDPTRFRFSVLQLLAPDAEARDVIAIEHGWMDRLHTREFGLNM